jgi:uncharacterized phage protein gp47/JayE
MASFNLKKYTDIYNDCKNYIIANQDRVTDFNDGSTISTEIEAFCREMAAMYSQARSGFSAVLAKIAYSAFKFSKQTATYASGAVAFTRADTTKATTVSSGTQVSTAGGVVFETIADVTVAIGTATVSVAVEAVDCGTSGNVAAATITTIVSAIAMDSVTNQSAISGGLDAETDAQYQARFLAYINGLGLSNKYGIIAGALTNSSLRSASIVECFPPSNGLYNLILYIDDGNGNASATTIAAVKSLIDGDGTKTNPGYRAAGINVKYAAPTAILINVTMTIIISYAIDSTLAKSDLVTAITTFINALTIGETMVIKQLEKTLFAYGWVLDVATTLPSANTLISDSEIARIGTIALTVTQAESV